MNRFLNFVIGLISFFSVVVLLEALNRRPQDQPARLEGFVYLVFAVGSIFFLQFALQRYLFPPNVFTKEQRKSFLEAAKIGYQKTFFRGTLGAGYLFLFFYGSNFFDPMIHKGDETNWMGWSLFFFLVGMLARVRAVILHLATQEKSSQTLPTPTQA
jgi:hypothetical protein